MKLISVIAAGLVLLAADAPAQVPGVISYQGRIAVNGLSFDGAGKFRFALVNEEGTATYWSNDGTSVAGTEPAKAVELQVATGLYSVLLGDTELPNMTVVPATVFSNGGVYLRVWFDDGRNGSQQLRPDQRIAAVGYAMMAEGVADGAITSEMIADGAVGSAKLADGAVTSAKISGGAVEAEQLASGAAVTNLTASGQAGVPKGSVVLSMVESQAMLNAGYVKIGVTATMDA